MKEVRMQVENEAEAIEYCQENNLDFVTCYDYDSDGKVMMLATTRDDIEANAEEKYLEQQHNNHVADTVIYYVNDQGTRLYIGKTDLTTNIKDAKKFPYNQARKKVVAMKKYNRYNWRFFRLI